MVVYFDPKSALKGRVIGQSEWLELGPFKLKSENEVGENLLWHRG